MTCACLSTKLADVGNEINDGLPNLSTASVISLPICWLDSMTLRNRAAACGLSCFKRSASTIDEIVCEAFFVASFMALLVSCSDFNLSKLIEYLLSLLT